MRNSHGRRALIPLVVLALVTVIATVVVVRFTSAGSASRGPDASSTKCRPSSCNSNYLNSVSCSSPSFCVAVGYYRERSEAVKTLIERWDGYSWAIMKSVDTKYGKDKLASVSCPSAKFCMAVGWDNVFEVGFTNVIEEWNGLTWRLVDRQPSTFAKLEGVQCFTAARCVAVGYTEKASSVPRTLVETWNGSVWSVVPSANETNPDVMFNDLHGISCVTTSNCVSVGSAETLNNDERAEVEEGNANKWNLVPSLDLGGANVSFAAVTCPRIRLCFAVGRYATGGPSNTSDHALVEAWNGTTWRKVTLPNPPLRNDSLTSVSCASASSCFVVGIEHQDMGGNFIIDHWNGKAWSTGVQPTSFASSAISLNGVTCVNNADCYAVGWYDSRGGGALSLIEHWNGSTWVGVPAPNYFG